VINIHLYGHLQKEFGADFRFDIATAGEAMRALNCAFPGRFVKELAKGSYRVIRGSLEDGMDIELSHVNEFKLGRGDLHIIPVASGSKNTSGVGTTKAVVGVALIGAAIFFSGGTLAAPLSGMAAPLFSGIGGLTYGTVAMVGLGLALSGASMLISKALGQPDDNQGSFSFSGPINVNQQGAAVPLIFGEVICGSQAVSAGFDIVDIGSNQSAWNGISGALGSK